MPPAPARAFAVLLLILVALVGIGISRPALAQEDVAADADVVGESADEGPEVPESPAAPVIATPGAYEVGPGDVLAVRVYGQDDFKGGYPVDEQGALNLPWVGAVPVSGLNVSEVSRKIAGILSRDYLRDPQVTVQVEVFGSKPVRVIGAVRKPGTYYLQGPTDLLGILTLAGGINTERSSSQVLLTRAGQAEPQVIDLNQLLSGGGGSVMLEAGDVINIPEGRVFYVSGELNKPGEFPWNPGITVTRAISMAGSYRTTANLRKAIIRRATGESIIVNIKKIYQGKAPDVPLMQGDQLIIEESAF